MSKLIYIASPFTHKDPAIREERTAAACKYAAQLMRNGYVAFSPIAHSTRILQFAELPDTTAFWLQQDLAILERCNEIHVLCLDGWQDSTGVKWELEQATNWSMTIRYIDPITFAEVTAKKEA